MKRLLILLLFVMPPSAGTAVAQLASDDSTAAVVAHLLEEGKARFEAGRDVEQLVSFYAERQLGIPYVGGLLEVPPVETLVVTLKGSDCVLFVETTTAFTLTTLMGSTDVHDFEGNVRMLRYRGGEIDGYFSRLHYFGDWLQDNERKGLLKVMFQGDDFPHLQPYSFMTAKREAYRQLAASDSLFALMTAHEKALNQSTLRYVPTDRIPSIEDQLQTGDIVAFVTTVEGLDVTHTAIVRRDGDRVSFWHASTTGSVIAEPKTLLEYTQGRQSLLGIIIARLSSYGD